ncbi:L-rhamnose-binding lectin CSL3-like, partial [Xiphophorus couchianus]|uniref:L-rhamnose-binding lectin CSL3-like n=1 Tax=Xiphophorus couchianus TaxID=32473 RepID=UPI00101699DE
CNGKQWCKVKASNYVFGDPCYGTYKYLEVEYICYETLHSLVEGTLLLVSPAAAAAWILHHNKMKFVLFTLFLCGFVLEINAGRGFQKPKKPRLSTQLQTAVACEGSEAQLSCANEDIFVVSAIYGRSDRMMCSYGIPDEQTKNTNCAMMANSVLQRCDGETMCTVFASSSVFGDPCVGTYKYLEVIYLC